MTAHRPARLRRVALWALGLLLSLQPLSAAAVWHQPQDVVHGTAATLEKDEFMMGLFTPAGYGLFESLTLFIHPINFVLLTPNGALRWRVYNGERFQLALRGEGAGTFLKDEQGIAGDRRVAFLSLGATGTVYLPGGVMLSLASGYQHDFALDSDLDDNGFTFSGAINWLIHPSHLLLTTLGAAYSFGTQQVTAFSGSIMYAYAFESNLRLGVGVAFGEFPLAGVTDPLPAWPVVDIWIRY